MKVLVIPDVHLKPWIFDKADELIKDGFAERVVCLMDLADDWNMEFQIEEYKLTYDRAIQFAMEHPDTLWCYGNHDFSYVWGYLETGYSVYAENTVVSKLRELENVLNDSSQIAIMHRVDKVLFAHGGLSAEFVCRLDESLIDADIDEVLHRINTSSTDVLWKDDSPLWLRPQYHLVDAFRRDEYTQVVGHTPVEKIYEESGFISVDVFSTYRDKTQIGESAFLVIETKTGEYEVKRV